MIKVKYIKKGCCFLISISLFLSILSQNVYAFEYNKQNVATFTSAPESMYNSYLDIDWGLDDDVFLGEIEQVENNFFYVVNDKSEAIITYYEESTKNLVIPSKLGGYNVTMIWPEAFSMLDNLESVTIPSGVKVIGARAFADCANLKTVAIPNTVTAIDVMAFAFNPNLNNVTVPNSVTKLAAGVFLDCVNLNNISLSNNISKISDSLFAGCTSLTEMKISNNITKIEQGAFKECTNLKKIEIPSSVTTIGDYAFDESDLVVIYGEYGSYAQKYASENEIKFVSNSSSGEVIKTGTTTGGLNVRSGSSTSYSKIGYLSQGTKVEIVQELSNGWYKIKYKSGYGYVSGSYIKIDSTVQPPSQGVIATGKTTGGLNVRSGSSTSYSKIGYLSEGAKVEIVEKLSNGWYKIIYGSSYGYVSGSYIQLDSQSDPTPPPSQEEVIATGKTTGGLNVRSGGSTSYSKIGYLSEGAKVEIVEKLSNGWYKIKYESGYGYVSGSYIKLDSQSDPTPPPSQEEVIATGKTTGGLNVRSGASTSHSIVGYLSGGTTVEIVEVVSDSWYKIKYQGSYAYVSSKYIDLSSTISVIDNVYETGIATENLNIRAGSSTDYEKIGYLPKLTKIEIIEKLINGWYKIKFNDIYGFVLGDYIDIDDDDDDNDIDIDDNDRDDDDDDLEGKALENLNIRAGSSTDYEKIGYLPKGEEVDILEKLPNGWYKIKYDDIQGYVLGEYIKIKSDDDDDDDKKIGKTKEVLNIRAGSSTDYEKIGYLLKGIKIEILEILSNGWCKIKYNDGFGYVLGEYIDFD